MTPAPPRRVAIAPSHEIPPGEARVYEVDELFVALCNVDGRIWAIEDRCTHDDGPFGDGPLHGHEIQCPRHGARFDVRDGAVCRMPACGPVPSFPVTVENGWVLIDLPEPSTDDPSRPRPV